MTPSPILPVSATNLRRVTFFPVIEAAPPILWCIELTGGSVSQIVQVVVSVGDRRDRILRLVVFHEVMLDSGLLALRKNLREVDRSRADVDHLVVGRSCGILDVDHLKAPRIAAEEIDRIATAEDDPVEIHLEVDELGVR